MDSNHTWGWLFIKGGRMNQGSFSLKNRLLIWVLASIALIWVTSTVFVWLDAKHELEEIFHKLVDHQISLTQFNQEKNELLGSLLWGLIWPLMLGLPVLFVVVYGVISWANRSLSQVKQAIFERRADSLDPIKIQGLPNEISPIVDELNDLLGRVKKSIEHERRFTSDAAHELRTPLAAIRAQAEILKIEKQFNFESINNLIESSDRASRLIEQLLALSRVESAHVIFDKDSLNLSEFVKKQIANAYPDIEKKQQKIQFLEDAVCTVRVNEGLLSILLRNLLDNAIRYSPMKGSIDVSVKQKDGKVYLAVEDSGSGLTKQEINDLGIRFKRMNQSDSFGSGLGWSIIKKIAEVQGLSLQVERSPELSGLMVTVRFSL
ncbi:GHKL domain-containing protein [Polynucleobacter sp. MWH-Spelu-300-X4]|nr:GHKL domain-containing protein [Polynucleobacter sp. MWH-Spelu-300-X4]